jgi:MFS family permease
MVGPAAAVFLATQLSTTAAMTAMAVGVAAIGIALFAVDPPVRSQRERAEDDGTRPPRREWLTPTLIGVLVVGAGAVSVLAGTEVAIVALLRGHGEIGWTGLVMAIWSAASIAGGLVYGARHRSSSGQRALMAGLGLLTIPIGLAGGHWWLVSLALLPAAALCAPTISATGEEVARLAPVAVRGVATGLQSSAFTLGAALGAPFAGFVVDHSTPGWGFAAAGTGGVAVAGVAALLALRQAQPASASAIS